MKIKRSRPAESHPEIEDTYDSTYPSPAGGGPNQVRRILGKVAARWYWIALGLVAGGASAAYYLSKEPPLYSASSSLLVKERADSILANDRTNQLDLKSAPGLNTFVEGIRRQEILEKVAADDEIRSLPGLVPGQVEWLPGWAANWLGRNTDAKTADTVPSPEALANRIRSWSGVDVRRNTRLVDITVRHQQPEVAKAIANAIARAVVDSLTDDVVTGRSDSMDLLGGEIERARERLEQARAGLAGYSRALELHTLLELKEAEFAEVRREYLRRHPIWIETNDQLQELRERFVAEFRGIARRGPEADFWESHFPMNAADWSEEETLDDARRSLTTRAGVLQSEINSQEFVFETMLTRMLETDVNSAAPDVEALVNSLATKPTTAVHPVPPKVMQMGLLGGGALGLGLALLLVRCDSRFRTVVDVEEETGLPVLAAVTEISSRLLRSVSATRVSPGTKRPWDPHLVFRDGLAETPVAEMYRNLRASISLLGDQQVRRVILVTSALPSEGKSTTAANLALAAVASGQRVLLVDLDVRKPSIHHLFGFERSETTRGMTGFLSGQAELEDVITRGLGSPDLDVAFGGQAAPRPGELLVERRLEELLEFARTNYDLVVIDSAPLLVVPDTRLISPHVDHACLVVRAEYCPKGAALRAIRLLEECGREPSGVILNRMIERRGMMSENYIYGNYRYGAYGDTVKRKRRLIPRPLAATILHR